MSIFISKLLNSFLRRVLLGVMVFLLCVACNSSRMDSNKNLFQPTSDCRIVQHSMGETCVPNNSQRVVTIFHGILGNAISFGVKPIASSTLPLEQPFPEYLGDRVVGIESVGLQNSPGLEKILIQKPDLILVWQNIQSIYPLLSKIAPTVVIPWHGPSAWQEHIEFVAKVLGKESEKQHLWKKYYQRIDELKVALSDRYQNKEISIVAPSSQWGYWIMAKNSFCGSIINDLGLKRPKTQDIDTEDGYLHFTSEEHLEMVDGDIMFALLYNEEDRKAFEKTLQTPLGQKLKAVQQGHIYFIEDGLPWNGATFLAANVVLDDLYKYLVNPPWL